MVDEAGGSHQEAVKTALLIESFDSVEDAAHNIVTAGGLAARKNDAYVKRLLQTLRRLILYKFHNGKTVSVWE